MSEDELAVRIVLPSYQGNDLRDADGGWKFKALGYDPNGDVIPGGGLLTDRHNILFVALDAALISAALARS